MYINNVIYVFYTESLIAARSLAQENSGLSSSNDDFATDNKRTRKSKYKKQESQIPIPPVHSSVGRYCNQVVFFLLICNVYLGY